MGFWSSADIRLQFPDILAEICTRDEFANVMMFNMLDVDVFHN